MNTELFIARRIIKGGSKSKKISKPIVYISILSIILGFAVMLVSVSVLVGYKNQIRDKVIGFGSHIQIHSISANQSYESVPLEIQQPFYPELEQLAGVEHIQIYAIKPGIIQAAGDTIVLEDEQKVNYDINGIIAKGIGPDFKANFFEDKIKKGQFLDVEDSLQTNMVVSQLIARRLNLDLGQWIDVFFIEKEKPIKRKFRITGIYDSGMEEFDGEIVFVDIRHIQALNKWGVSTYLEVNDSCKNGRFVIEASAKGGNGNYYYDWGNGWGLDHQRVFCPLKDTTFKVITTDFSIEPPGSLGESVAISIPDTAWLSVKVDQLKDTADCACSIDEDLSIPATYGDNGFYRKLTTPEYKLTAQLRTSGGSEKYYVGGFEVTISDWERLEAINETIQRKKLGPDMESTTIKEIHPEIFNWLEILDINVLIILVLMIIVAVINMSSALLVLILERTNMIGMLKAMGFSNWSIRKIFLYNAIYLIGLGLVIGNIIAIGFGWAQQEFGFITLPEETYYLSKMPIEMNPWYILLLNLGTIVICAIVMMLPSYLITRIKPIKSIRFN